MVVQLYSMPINVIDTLPERFERKYYLIPPEVGFAYGLLRQTCFMDSKYPSEQINSLYFDTADLDQYARSASGDFRKDKVRIRWYSQGEKLSGTQTLFTELKSRRGFASTKQRLYINGGYIVIDALGDGFDVNGPVYMTSGSLIINGPIRNDNGALDYTGVFQMSGGFLIAVGSAGMAQAPSASSTQDSAALRYSSLQSAGTIVHIQTEDGEGVLTFVPTKAYQSVVLCSPQLKEGVTYIVYSGGSSTGTVTDGLYSGGTYTPGTELGSFTL